MKILPSYPYASNGENVLLAPARRFGNPNFRLNNLTIATVLLSTIVFSLLIIKSGPIAGLLILTVIIGLPVIYCVVVYPEIGILVLLIASYLVMWVIRMGVDFPLGTLIDALQMLLLLGFFIKKAIPIGVLSKPQSAK